MAQELNPDKKIEIKNLCGWDLYFGLIETNGSVRLPANGVRRIPFAEIQAQVNDQNVMFVGDDGEGTHARIYINDKDVRIALGLEEENRQQQVLTEEVAKTIFKYKQQKTF